MTTNFVNRFDPALDRQLFLRMSLRFRPDSANEDAQRSVDRVRKGGKRVVPARLHEFFLVDRHKELDDVFQRVNDLWQDLRKTTFD